MSNKKVNINLKRFGQHIKELRKERKLSLRKLSANCNLDWADISKMERGEINITFLTMMELAAGLEIPPYKLLLFDLEDKDITALPGDLD